MDAPNKHEVSAVSKKVRSMIENVRGVYVDRAVYHDYDGDLGAKLYCHYDLDDEGDNVYFVIDITSVYGDSACIEIGWTDNWDNEAGYEINYDGSQPDYYLMDMFNDSFRQMKWQFSSQNDDDDDDDDDDDYSC